MKEVYIKAVCVYESSKFSTSGSAYSRCFKGDCVLSSATGSDIECVKERFLLLLSAESALICDAGARSDG